MNLLHSTIMTALPQTLMVLVLASDLTMQNSTIVLFLAQVWTFWTHTSISDHQFG
jgi:hypothetical protein